MAMWVYGSGKTTELILLEEFCAGKMEKCS